MDPIGRKLRDAILKHLRTTKQWRAGDYRKYRRLWQPRVSRKGWVRPS